MSNSISCAQSFSSQWMVDSAQRPGSFSQDRDNTMRFVSPSLQATGQSEGAPAIQIKWLNSLECYVLSAWRMPSWFVLISDHKSVGNKAVTESKEFPCFMATCSPPWPQCCMKKVSAYGSLTIILRGRLQQTDFFPFFLKIQSEPNLPRIINYFPWAPTKPITRQIIFGEEKAHLSVASLLQ